MFEKNGSSQIYIQSLGPLLIIYKLFVLWCPSFFVKHYSGNYTYHMGFWESLIYYNNYNKIIINFKIIIKATMCRKYSTISQIAAPSSLKTALRWSPLYPSSDKFWTGEEDSSLNEWSPCVTNRDILQLACLSPRMRATGNRLWLWLTQWLTFWEKRKKKTLRFGLLYVHGFWELRESQNPLHTLAGLWS